MIDHSFKIRIVNIKKDRLNMTLHRNKIHSILLRSERHSDLCCLVQKALTVFLAVRLNACE